MPRATFRKVAAPPAPAATLRRLTAAGLASIVATFHPPTGSILAEAPSSGDGPVFVWFRNDLRLTDNPALDAAVRTGRPILCIYVFDEESPGLRALGGASRWWLHHSLASLGKRIAHSGGTLALLRGPAAPAIEQLAERLRPSQLVFNRRYIAAERAVDEAVVTTFRARGVPTRSFNGSLGYEPHDITPKAGGFFRVYTPFWRATQAHGPLRPPLGAPARLPSAPVDTVRDLLVPLESLDLLPRHPDWAGDLRATWSPGEDGAAHRLERFLAALPAYAEDRDRPDLDGTSSLSPHLRFGEISPQQIWARAETAGSRGAQKFLQELVWRDFSYNLLFHVPAMEREPFNPAYRRFPFARQRPELLEAWQRGRTGYPIVDAGMRQLWTTGFMHNRVRMIAASFLVKDLLYDWRLGEAWFWDTLCDADPANNVAGWQWVAGCGADAAPFFRVFNPILQGEKFDPDGRYVARYVPELARLDARYIHRPWEAPPDVLASAGLHLGRSYPTPIVDHGQARETALAALAALRT